MVQLKQFHSTLLRWVHLLLLLHVVDAQSSVEPVPTYISHHNWESSFAITIGVIICALLFMGIISIYIRNCAESRIPQTNRVAGDTTEWPCSCSQGINKELLNTFPVLFYSTIKDLKKGKGELECAVCLSDFKDNETLRLLPKCNHVFHPGCIDSWLASHVTCPVCRANLNQDSCEVAITMPTHLSTNQMSSESSDTVVEHGAGEENEIVQNPVVLVHNMNEDQSNDDEGASKLKLFGKLSRSNSTGHSLVEPGKSVERYTLRLPEDVRRHILLNHGTVHRSASYNNSNNNNNNNNVVMPMVGSSRKGLCWSDSEGSSRGKRNNADARLERWVLWTPSFVARNG